MSERSGTACRPSAASAIAATIGAVGESDTESDEALRVLRRVFGYDSFRGDQRAIIDQVTSGGDALVLMPTGGGKSLCYQVPALVRAGVGVVTLPITNLYLQGRAECTSTPRGLPPIRTLLDGGVTVAAMSRGPWPKVLRTRAAWNSRSALRSARSRSGSQASPQAERAMGAGARSGQQGRQVAGAPQGRAAGAAFGVFSDAAARRALPDSFFPGAVRV